MTIEPFQDLRGCPRRSCQRPGRDGDGIEEEVLQSRRPWSRRRSV